MNAAQQPAIILLTRPLAQAKAYARDLAAAIPDARIVLSPLIGIEFAPSPTDMGEVRGLLLTSQNGVAAYRHRYPGFASPVWCVGAQTARAAAGAGLRVAGHEPTVTALIQRLLAEAPDGPLLHLRGRHQRGDLAAALSAAGIPCRDHIAYDQPALPLTDEAKGMLSGADRVYCPLFSPRTAGLFRNAVGSPPPPAVHVVAISASAASALQGWGAPVDIARNPDAASVTLALQAQIAAKNLP